ncbi:hypothetical protein SLE2022_241320 [Rubroshorea leprosula]
MEVEHVRNCEVTHRVTKKPIVTSLFISDSEIREEFSHHQPPASLESTTGISGAVLVLYSRLSGSDEKGIVPQSIGRRFAEGKFQKNDAVLMLHCAFQAVKKAIQAGVTRAGGSVVQVPLPFPVNSEEEIIAEFRKAIAKGKPNGRRIRLAIIDHITSMLSVVIPVQELVRICRGEGVDQVFVNAAHAIGSVKAAIEVPIYYQEVKNGDVGVRDKDGFITGYARISQQVYNKWGDYEKFRNAINQLVEDGRKVFKMLLMR